MNDVIITDNSKDVIAEMISQKAVALEAVGLTAEGHAKLELENDPRRIDTGRLRNSISHAVDGDDAYIGTNVEYGIYVHEGVRYPSGNTMKPNRFLRNAVEKNIRQYKDIIDTYMKK